VAKAAPWTKTDAQVRKRGEQTGLDTLVVVYSLVFLTAGKLASWPRGGLSTQLSEVQP